MREYFHFWVIWFLAVFLVFNLQQAVFLTSNFKQLQTIPFLEICQSFWVSRKLNFSMFCYLSGFPLIAFIIQINLRHVFIRRFMLFYGTIIFLLFFCLSTAELALYKEWGTKLNFKALSYLRNPSEVIRTASLNFILFFLVAVILQSGLILCFLYKFLPVKIDKLSFGPIKNFAISLVTLLGGLFIIVVGLRGGLQPIPINQSASYFSKHDVLNLAATNSIFNVVHSVLQNKKTTTTNIYKVLDEKKAIEIVSSLHKPLKDTTVYFLSDTRPNIFLFVLEGWAGDAVGACNGDSSLTPFFNSLANKGINFERCYASGNRSDQGMAGIFSAFPAQSLTSIIEQPDKFSKLPCIVRSLKNNGYSTSFYFGGQLSYANIESYMVFNGVDKIVDLKTLESIYPSGRLGVHDEYVLDYISKELKGQRQPFFITFFTGSTHAPYDIPRSAKRTWGTDMDAYANSMIYADSCLMNFFENNKNESWFKKTLFVFVSDHSHMTHRWFDYHDMLNRHIPLVFYGEPIKPEFKGKSYKQVVSQTDLAATLLAQLKISHNDFFWSKNVFNPFYSHFAFYSFPSGSGWVTDTNAFSYNYQLNKYEWSAVRDTIQEKQDLLNMKAYMQVMFQQYLDY